jgi:hypothetical protein
MTEKKDVKEEKKVVSIFDAYGTNPEKEKDGVWCDLLELPGARARVARFSNPNAQKMMKRLQEPYKRRLRTGKDLPDDVQEEILNKVMAHTILLELENVNAPDEKGVIRPVSNNPENFLLLLKDPRLKDFRDEIADYARTQDLYKQDDDEEAVENLKN